LSFLFVTLYEAKARKKLVLEDISGLMQDPGRRPMDDVMPVLAQE
jgi:hypothetical protein